MPPPKETAPKTARVYGPFVLAEVLSGKDFAEIAAAQALTQKQVERFLRTELRKRWIAPSQDHARLQIARLDRIVADIEKRRAKDLLPAIDRLLKVMDRLDRYHAVLALRGARAYAEPDMREALARLVDQSAKALALEP